MVRWGSDSHEAHHSKARCVPSGDGYCHYHDLNRRPCKAVGLVVTYGHQWIDPNWLLSTTAQSAAALVAIVGGFLISRVVAISTTRQGLEQRLTEIGVREEAVARLLTETSQQIEATAESWFRDLNLDDYVDARGATSPETVRKSYWPKGAEQGQIERWANDFGDEVRRCFEAVEGALRDYEATAEENELASRGVDTAAFDPRVLAAVRRRVTEERSKRLSIHGVSTAPPVGFVGSEPSSEVDEHINRIKQKDDLNAEVRALQAEAAIVRGELHKTADPHGVSAGIAVLSLLSLTGIVLPLAMMASRPVMADIAARRLVFFGFTLGLVGLLVYILWLVRSLRRP